MVLRTPAIGHRLLGLIVIIAAWVKLTHILAIFIYTHHSTRHITPIRGVKDRQGVKLNRILPEADLTALGNGCLGFGLEDLDTDNRQVPSRPHPGG